MSCVETTVAGPPYNLQQGGLAAEARNGPSLKSACHRIGRIEYIRDIEARALPKNVRRLDRLQSKFRRKPGHHLAGRVLPCLIKWARVAHGEDFVFGFSAWPADRAAFVELYSELDFERGLDPVAHNLAVALRRVAVAEVEQRP